MKTFNQFITEAYDKDLEGQASRAPGEGGRIRAARKKRDGYLSKQQQGQKPKVKAIGGGKTAPAKDYKPRKDIGTNKPRSRTQQQPTKERGSAALSAKEAQKKAYLERKKRESATKDEASGKDKKIDLKKEADKILSKKAEKKVDPKYKPQKASGMTRAERQSLTRRGEKKLRDLTLAATGKKKESELKHPITHKERARRAKAKS